LADATSSSEKRVVSDKVEASANQIPIQVQNKSLKSSYKSPQPKKSSSVAPRKITGSSSQKLVPRNYGKIALLNVEAPQLAVNVVGPAISFLSASAFWTAGKQIIHSKNAGVVSAESKIQAQLVLKKSNSHTLYY
jgi:hypothetical protein